MTQENENRPFPDVTTEELNALADALIAKLERIKALWAEMPNEDDIESLARAMGSIAATAAEIVETYNSDDFPCTDDCDDLNRTLANIANDMTDIVGLQGQISDTAEPGQTETIQCLTGVPNNDVPKPCAALAQVANAVDADITPEAHLKAFNDFYTRCVAFATSQDRHPSKGGGVTAKRSHRTRLA